MKDIGFVKKSTFILTIIILLIVFAVSITSIIIYYENKDMKINIPTVVQDGNDVSNNSNDILGISIDS